MSDNPHKQTKLSSVLDGALAADAQTIGDFVQNSPRAAILRAINVEAQEIAFMEPADVFDPLIEGITMIDGKHRVVYNEQACIAMLGRTRFNGDFQKAIDYFAEQSQRTIDLPDGGVLHGPVFVTNVMDLVAAQEH